MDNENLGRNQLKKRRCFTPDEIDNLIKMYKDGATHKEMIDTSGMSKTTICRTLKKYGVIEHRTTGALSDDDISRVIQMYTDNIPVTYIAKIYSCGVQTIYNYLRRLDINRTRNSVRKYQFDIHYFDVIDTPNKAYCLGLLFADGCNFDRSINLFLQAPDSHLLEDICQEIGYNGELEFRDRSKDREKGINCQDVYGLRLHSAYMCDVLSNCGMVPNKSLILQFPTCVPDHLISHFMRGYMDGDGHIGRTEKDNSVNFVGTLNFCESMNCVFEKQLGITFNIREAGNHNGITMECSARNKADRKLFLDWIYQDAGLKLERKYQTYLSKYCNLYNTNNTLTA